MLCSHRGGGPKPRARGPGALQKHPASRRRLWHRLGLTEGWAPAANRALSIRLLRQGSTCHVPLNSSAPAPLRARGKKGVKSPQPRPQPDPKQLLSPWGRDIAAQPGGQRGEAPGCPKEKAAPRTPPSHGCLRRDPTARGASPCLYGTAPRPATTPSPCHPGKAPAAPTPRAQGPQTPPAPIPGTSSTQHALPCYCRVAHNTVGPPCPGRAMPQPWLIPTALLL